MKKYQILLMGNGTYLHIYITILYELVGRYLLKRTGRIKFHSVQNKIQWVN